MSSCNHCGFHLIFRWKRTLDDGTVVRYKRPCPIHIPSNPNCPGN